MAIAKGYKTNFDTLQRAINNGDAALVECTDKQTGKPVMVVCAMEWHPEDSVDGEWQMKPFAKLFDGNPYEELNPPQ